MNSAQVYRTSFSKVIAWAALAAGVAALVAVPLAGGTVVSGLTAALPCAVVWVLFFDPCVVIDDAGVEVRNVLRTARVPWGALASARVRYSFEVVTTAGKSIEAWALARGSRGRTGIADEACAAVTSALAGRGDDEPTAAASATWNVRALIVLAAGIVLTAIGLLA